MVSVRDAMAVTVLVLVLVFLTSLQECKGAKILGLFPVPSPSHAAVSFALVKELAQRGHQVTVLSPYPQEEPVPNYTDIALQKIELKDVLNITVVPNPYEMQSLNYFQRVPIVWAMGIFLCDRVLGEPSVQKLVHSDGDHFDIIIMAGFYVDCLLGFAHKFKAPVVQVCPFGGAEYIGDTVGNPNPYSYIPDVFQEFSDKMSFGERIINTLCQLFQQVGRRYFLIPRQEVIMRKHFNYTSSMPSIADLEKSTALVLVNQHFSISYPKPVMPNFVQVGGMHIKAPKSLPADIKKYVEEATEGVIFFSMGSNLKSSQLPDKKLRGILEAFSKVKQRVLWKWESESLPGKPSNVKVAKWLPQSDILAHPNVRLFITHGGLLSAQETIYHGVPIVGIPVFGDQRLNMAKAVSSGYGFQLDYTDVTAESLGSAIREVLDNPRYRENAQRLSRIYRDQPLTPLEQAVFWTEYVIRHKGAPHMRSAALDLTWYQYFLLDVIAVLALAVGSIVFLVFLIVRKLLRKMCGGSKRDVIKKTK